MIKQEKIFIIVRFSIILLVLTISLILFKYFSKIFFPLIISFYLYYALEPLSFKLSKTFLGENGGPLLTVFLMILILVIIFSSFLPTIISQVKEFFSSFPDFLDRAVSFLEPVLRGKPKGEGGIVNEIRNQIISNIKDSIPAIINAFPSIGSFLFRNINNLILFILYLFIIPFFTYYLLKDFSDFKKKKFSENVSSNLRKRVEKFDSLISNFIRGQLTICLIVAILYSIGLLIIGVPFALLLGFIGGIGDIIPYLGTYSALALSILVSLTYSPSLKTVIFILFLFAIVKGIDNLILSPKIIGKSSGLHPVIVLTSIFMGGKLLGIMGMLLAIPVTALIKILFEDLTESLSSIS